MGKLLITFLMIILFILFVVFSILDKSDKEEKKIRIILNFGVFLILTSSVIFTVSSWNSLSDGFKSIFLFSQTIIFLFFGLILKYAFKIKNTGNALNLIAIVLFNISYLFLGSVNSFNTSFIL